VAGTWDGTIDEQQEDEHFMLSHCRVLDLTNERGLLCGQVLGDLGADVIKIEPVGGSPVRRLAPFFEDQPGTERSIYWWAYNRNKRGLTLDLEREQGRAIFKQLAATADFVIESSDPGYWSRRGLGYGELSTLNPRLIMVSITPFGQNGPKSSYADSDLIIMAAGGVLILYGDEDRPPIRMSVPQAYLHASVDAAFAALVACYERLDSGLGQHIDVAAQESIGLANQSTALSAPLNADETGRMAGGAKLGPLRVPLVWQAKDGQISFVFLFVPHWVSLPASLSIICMSRADAMRPCATPIGSATGTSCFPDACPWPTMSGARG
jgi:crotonobetainyl-CoA:carnitine CoA-transferase CaiB-like acyl-CoA transferase